MFLPMKPLLLAALVIAGCRSSDGATKARADRPAAQPAAETRTPQAAQSQTQTDSSRVDDLLERADRARIQGDSTAPVWLVEISDFQCPFCKRWHDETYPTLVRDYVAKGIVRMAYVHLPLQMHQHAFQAAEASMCAAVQDRFWPMHDKLFDTQARWAAMTNVAPLFDSLAVASGARGPEFRECMRSMVMRRVINGDRTRAASASVISTPVFFVGTERINGAEPIQVFRDAIERARAKAARPPSR
jgi:protein-disulfide isomerase